jgi:hypothetical protein
VWQFGEPTVIPMGPVLSGMHPTEPVRRGEGEAGDSSLWALLAASIWRAGPSDIFLRGFPRCGGGAATKWPSL